MQRTGSISGKNKSAGALLAFAFIFAFASLTQLSDVDDGAEAVRSGRATVAVPSIDDARLRTLLARFLLLRRGFQGLALRFLLFGC